METIEEFAQHYSENWEVITGLDWENTYPIEASKIDFISGAKWQEKRMYSEEEVLELLSNFNTHTLKLQKLKIGNSFNAKEWFNQFKKQ
jgi:hypothetical protein